MVDRLNKIYCETVFTGFKSKLNRYLRRKREHVEATKDRLALLFTLKQFKLKVHLTLQDLKEDICSLYLTELKAKEKYAPCWRHLNLP